MCMFTFPLMNAVSKAPESGGYYERVPIRIGEFALVKNVEGKLVFETTDSSICDEGPKVVLTVSSSDGWSVEKRQGSYYHTVTSSIDIDEGRLTRRRAFWHAGQFMQGRKLSEKKRFSLVHRVYNDDNAGLFEDDAYFKNGDVVTTDPFGEFLE